MESLIVLLGQLFGYLAHHVSGQDVSKHRNKTTSKHGKERRGEPMNSSKSLGGDTNLFSGWLQTINTGNPARAGLQNSKCIHFQTAYPVLSSSCLASLSLQANSSLKAVSCWVLKDFFCFLCSSKYDSSVNIGFTYFCMEGAKGQTVNHDRRQEMWDNTVWKFKKNMKAIKKVCENSGIAVWI